MAEPNDELDGGLEFTVASNLGAARIARRGVEELRWVLEEETFQDLRLLLSELVTNVVRHAGIAEGAPIRVRVRRGPGVCSADVTSNGVAFEAPDLPADTPGRAEGGFGLAILARLASQWGVELLDDGTRVWFELRDVQ